jgi:hypothetical protein
VSTNLYINVQTRKFVTICKDEEIKSNETSKQNELTLKIHPTFQVSSVIKNYLPFLIHVLTTCVNNESQDILVFQRHVSQLLVRVTDNAAGYIFPIELVSRY